MSNLDHYFMSLAKAVAKNSEDPSTKVGCVIVTDDYKAVSFGCNNFVSRCDKSFMTYERPYKYSLVVHAEMNALIAAERSLKNCRVYVTHATCPNCLRNLLEAGVQEIVYDKFNTNGNLMTKETIDMVRALVKSVRVIFRNIDGKDYLNLD